MSKLIATFSHIPLMLQMAEDDSFIVILFYAILWVIITVIFTIALLALIIGLITFILFFTISISSVRSALKQHSFLAGIQHFFSSIITVFCCIANILLVSFLEFINYWNFNLVLSILMAIALGIVSGKIVTLYSKKIFKPFIRQQFKKLNL